MAEWPDKRLTFSWPSNAVAAISNLVYDDFVCIGAWRYCTTDRIVGILDTVRNRLLNFILELEDLSPEAGEDTLPEHMLPADKVTQLFLNNVLNNGYSNLIITSEVKMGDVFNQQGQVVQAQYNAAGDFNFGAMQTSADIVAMLEQIQAMLVSASRDGEAENDAVIDAEASLKKAVAQAKKPEPDKKSIIERLNQAKAALEGVATSAKVVAAIAAAVPVVQKLLQG